MTNHSMHTEEYKFYSNTLVHLLVTMLDWVIVRATVASIERIVISYDAHEWKASVYYWIKG